MIRPLYDRVVVRRIEEEARTKSGLYIPEQAKERPSQGEILAAGKGRRLENGSVVPMDAQVGDSIIFGKYSGTEIELDGEKLLILREDEILGIV